MPSPPLNLRTRAALADAAGVVIILALAWWVAFFAGGGAGRPAPVLWLLGGILLAVAVGRATAGRPEVVPRIVALAILGAIALTWPGALGPAGAPLGYANANGTLAGLGALMAVGAAGTSRSVGERNAWLGLGVGFGAATAVTGSWAGLISLSAALLLLVLSAVARWPAAVIVGGLIVLSLGLGLTSAIAAGDDPAGLGERTGVRGELWVAAADLAAEHPGRGIGPGMFAELNPVTDDADLRWAHHGYLQVAAELGFVGLGLVLALIGWVSCRLWIASVRAPVRSAFGGAAVLVVGLHATVDYVWHVPAVLLVLAVVIGAATGEPRGEGSNTPGVRLSRFAHFLGPMTHRATT